MRRLSQCVVALFAFCSIPPLARAQSVPHVRVDERVELAAVMCRLAGFEEYQAKGIPAYDRAVAAYFEPYARHASIETLRRLRRDRGVSYSATVELALAARPGTWEPRVPLEGEWISGAWDARSAGAFLHAAGVFARDTNAAAFFDGQRALYAAVEAQIRSELAPAIDLGWFERHFGAGSARFAIVPALLNGPNSYGPHVAIPGGGVEIYAVLATPTFDEGAPVRYPIDQLLGLLVHELSHSYVNPWVDRNAERLATGAQALYACSATAMKADAYGDWRILVYESLVRASTVRYFRDHGDAAQVRRALADDRAKGFVWTDALADELTGDGDGGPRFAASASRVFAFFDAWGRDATTRIAAARDRIAAEEAARLATGPQLLGLAPADGAMGVDSSVTVLEIRFDRPMTGGMSVLGTVPTVTGRPSWDPEKRTLRIPVALEAGATYRMFLNSDTDTGFTSAAGEPLVPRVWTFRTRPK